MPSCLFVLTQPAHTPSPPPSPVQLQKKAKKKAAHDEEEASAEHAAKRVKNGPDLDETRLDDAAAAPPAAAAQLDTAAANGSDAPTGGPTEQSPAPPASKGLTLKL